MPWLLSDEALVFLRSAAPRSAVVLPAPTAMDAAPLYAVEGRTAIIGVEGILTPEPDRWMAYVYGANTGYSTIVAAVRAANADPKIINIRLEFGRVPGGDVMGLFGAMDAIADSEKPVEAFVRYQATSAGYGLASQAGKIIAADRGVVLGSVGVAVDAFVDEHLVSVSSTEAPDKRPDLSTEEGRAVVRKELDEIHDLFVAGIARGRGTTVEKVNADFGRGGLIMAESALKINMIDKVESRRASGTKKAGGKKVEDEKTFEDGVQAERARVASHLALAVVSGAFDVALEAIKSGSPITAEISTRHIEAGVKSRAQAARVADATQVASTVDAEDSFEMRCLRAYESGVR
jgi:ClpP class serine protease